MRIIGLFKDHPDVPVFVGGCVSRGKGSSFRARAHAHVYRKNPAAWYANRDLGWICVRSPKRIFKRDGVSPSNTMLHELAHVLTNDGHTDRFRAKLRELGGRATLNARRKRRRMWT